ncbi:MAG: hypothetical protein QM765_38145 [Myxococcales bacterium]
MRSFTLPVAALAALSMLAACGGGSNLKADLDASKQKKAKIALVSLTVSDFGRSLQFGNTAGVGDLITKKMDEMAALTETTLGTSWTVVPAASFATTEPYTKLAKGDAKDNLYTATNMKLFAADRSDQVKTKLDPQMAKDLCAALGTDLVAVVYSEWTTVTGGFVPTTKAYAKTVFSIWDNQGRQLYKDRKDVEGSKTLGAFGRAQVDENSLDVWVGAYKTGLDKMMSSM